MGFNICKVSREGNVHEFDSMCSSCGFDYLLFPFPLDLSSNGHLYHFSPLLNKARSDWKMQWIGRHGFVLMILINSLHDKDSDRVQR